MRLVDADAVKGFVHGWKLGKIPKGELLWKLDQVPTVDAVPVVHGRWKYGTRAAVCSECGFERHLDDNYGRAIACPNCGAKMDLEGEKHG